MKNNFLKIAAFLAFGFGFSQTPISLKNAINKAFSNNLNIKSGELKINYQEKLKGSAITIDPLNISAEVGQINSAYTDNRFSINQTIRLPKFYNAQKTLLLEEWKSSVLNLNLQKWQLKKEISLVYNDLKYLDEKKKLLKKADSIFTQYYNRAELRLKKGESNLLEKATAENLKSQANMQLKALEKDKEIALQKLNYLINDGTFYQNEKGKYEILNFESLSTGYAGNPLVLKQLEQEKNIQNAKLATEKTKLIPSFNLAYNNTSMYGNGADDKFYNHSTRFHSGMIGVGIPVFNSAQKSVIEAQKINQQIAENNYQLGLVNLKNQFSQYYGQFQKLNEEIDYYQKTGLNNSESIFKTANNQYFNGEINYLEWTLLVTQAFDIENKYVDKLKELNDNIIELNALKNE
ncbi:TolC family protein [Cloacibacterium sp.]|uniref:TolC family protein n=1 Tax=Cloacibacterium sp. TaxID=1913682 RepID=UPI0035AE85F9